MKQLQVVNHEKLYPILLRHSPRLGSQLQDGQTGRVIDEQRRIGQLACRARELGEILGLEKTMADVP